MTLQPHRYHLVTLGMGTLFALGACTGSEATPSDGGNVSGSGGSNASGAGGSGSGSGGASPTTGAGGASPTTGAGGTSPTTGAGGTSPTTGAGGTAGTGAGGTTGTGGAGGASNPTGAGGTTAQPALDCGAIGVVVENAGPPANRVNMVILPDGYTAETVNTTMMQHVQAVMARRFAPTGQPYLRYRKFVNICALKIVSQNNGAALGTPAAAGPTAFNCGEYQPGTNSRLASCNTNAAMTAQTANLPATFMVDWHTIMLNNSEWWNSGGPWMLFSGGNVDAPGAALHEGGHGFHQLADEYGTCTGANCGSNTMGTGTAGTANNEVNSAGNPMTTDGKWSMWIGFTQTGATGLQGTWLGSRYVGTGQYRPSANSMMNSLFCNAPRGGDPTACVANTSFNTPSAEKMIMDIWRNVMPVDSMVPPAGAVNNPATLTVNVIDPLVIDVDWSVDGAVVAAKGGQTFTVTGRGLTPGTHTISAKAYDNAGQDLVRYRTGTTFGRMNWARSVQTVNWTVTIP